MPEPSKRPPREFSGYRTYYCDRCRRNVYIVGNQEQPNYHRENHGKGRWCVAPPSAIGS